MSVLLGKSYKGINLHRLLALGFSSFRHLASNLKGFECLHDVVHFVGLRVPNLRMFVNVDDDHTV